METVIADIKNKKEKQVLTAFLSSLNMSYRTEQDEENALIEMYKKAKLKKEKAVPFDALRLQQ